MVREIISEPYLQKNLQHFQRSSTCIHLDLQNSPYAQKQHRRLGYELKQKLNGRRNIGTVRRVKVKSAPHVNHDTTSETECQGSDNEQGDESGIKNQERSHKRMERSRQQFRQIFTHQSSIRGSLKKDSILNDTSKISERQQKRIERTRKLFGQTCSYQLPQRSSKDPIAVDTSRTRCGIEVLRVCMKHLGLKEFNGRRQDEDLQKCALHWRTDQMSHPGEMKSGLVNKFPGMSELMHKTSLFRMLSLMKSVYPEEYTFFPRSWSLPDDYKAFKTHVEAVKESGTNNKPTFIVKPRDGTQGVGIYLIRNPTEYKLVHRQYDIVQEYLWDVFLIDQFKFDLRVYCLIKSIEPLEIHICREGIARFSTVPYENPTNENINVAFMHLTNYSLNKKSQTFVASDEEDQGSKRTLSSVFKLIESKGFNTEKLWVDIEKVVCKTIIAVLPDLKVEYHTLFPPNQPRPSCFQLLGFDILLLRNLKPSLLEVNASPSLDMTHEVETSKGHVETFLCKTDVLIKVPLIRDTLEAVLSLKKECRDTDVKSEVVQGEECHIQTSEIDTDDKHSNLIPQAPRSERPSTTRSIFRRLSRFGFGKRENEKTLLSAGNDSNLGNYESCPYDLTQNSSAKCTSQGQSSQDHSSNTELVSVFDDNNNCDFGDDDDDQDGECDKNDEDTQTRNAGKDYFSEVLNRAPTLRMIYPECYAGQYEKLRVLERFAKLFLAFIKLRRGRRLCNLGFKEFIRKCLPNKNIPDRIIDMLYFDGTHYQENYSGYPGLSFEGFVNSCKFLAKRLFTGRTTAELLTNLLNYCEDRFDEALEEISSTQCSDNRFSKLSQYSRGQLSMTDNSKLIPVRRTRTSLSEN